MIRTVIGLSAFREDDAHLRVLTGIRGWAAIWVFLYHAWVYAPERVLLPVWKLEIDLTAFLCIGGAGVSVFFVLSGFLLALPFVRWQAGQRARPSLSRYFYRRVLRVFPAYYAQFALLLVVAALAPSLQPGIAGTTDFGRHLLMLFIPPPLGMQPINGVWWTLPIEFSFYLVLPFLAVLLRPGRWFHLLVLSLFVMWLWRHLFVIWLDGTPIPERVVASYQLPGSMDMFGLGMLTAMLHVHRASIPAWVLPRRGTGRLAVLGLALWVVAIYWLNEQGGQYWADNPIFYLWTPALSLGAMALLLAGATDDRFVNIVFGNRFMVFAGTISYSLYLWHLPLLSWLAATDWFRAWEGSRLSLVLLTGFPLGMIAASLSYLLVERPFMRLRND